MEEDKDQKDPPKDSRESQVELVTQKINEYRKLYEGMSPNVLRNMIELKDITRKPKHDQPDAAYSDIKAHLGDEESGETLRQERWNQKVRCIACGSRNIKRLPASEQKAPNNYRYQCLDCEKYFNDDSETEIENGTPPLYSWMFCWYLLGCTDSMQYIANKLGLELVTVEMMVRHMQKLFKAKQPLGHFKTFDEWSRMNKNHKEQIKESLKKRELLRGDNPDAELDTAERRRQKNAKTPPKPRNRGA